MADTKKRKIANRELIDSDGSVTKDWAEATGFRYTFLETGGNVEHQCGEAGDPTTMFACFGGLTKIGNIVNSIVNGDDYDGRDPMPEAEKWLEKLASEGEWRAPAEGGKGRGPKYDKEKLAMAVLEVVGEKATTDIAGYIERLTDDRKYFNAVLRSPDVMQVYYNLQESDTDLDAIA